MNKKSLVFAVCLMLCLGLTACGKEKKVEETSEVVSTEESTEDKFAVYKEFNLDETETESNTEDAEAAEAAEIESMQAEYVYTNPESGKDVDIRDSNGMAGLLSYVSESGGIEALKEESREDLEFFLNLRFSYLTEEEIGSFIETVYGEDTEKKAQLEEAVEEQSKADSGLVYTDEGWKDVYNETASGSGLGTLEDSAEGGYTPLDSEQEGITIYGY